MNREKDMNLDDVALFIRTIIEFEAHTTRREFQTIFGYEAGFDLWIKFSIRCDNNTTIFYRILEEQEQRTFDEYIARRANSIAKEEKKKQASKTEKK